MDPLKFLASAADLERDPARHKAFEFLGLGRIRTLSERFGHPEQAFPQIVHIAGTKGKGSTAAMTAALLSASGMRTGLYTSPHVLSFWERIQVDGKPIHPRTFARLLKPHVGWAARMPRLKRPSYFEWVTAVALAHFRERKCEAVVLETGLGGRLDATNTVHPSVTAITRIDFDHMDLLGHTLGRIAREKAGILKPGVPCVLPAQPPEAMREIRKAAKKRGVPLIRTRPYRGRLALLGDHQRENAGVALGILKALGIRADLRTLASVTLPGRIQVLRRSPPLVVDGAHNPLSVRVLVRTLGHEFPDRSWTVAFGTASDKDVGSMLRELKSSCSRLIAMGYSNPRAMLPGDIVRAARRLGIFATAGSLEDLGEGPVLVTGSLWLAGEAIRRFSGNRRGEVASKGA